MNPFELSKMDDITLVKLHGRLDRDTLGQVEDLIARIKKERHIRVVFDFETVEYIFSAALGKLILLLKEQKELGGGIRVARLNRAIDTIFEITNLKLIIPVHTDVEEAFSAFKAEISLKKQGKEGKK